MTGRSLSERLAEYAYNVSFDQLPELVVEKLKTIVVHDLAVAIGGSRTAEARQALDFIESDVAGAGHSTIIGTGGRSSPLDATFVNTVMMRALRQEDSIPSCGIHAGPLLIPAALALAEHEQRSGRELIAALVAGYDVFGKLVGSQWSWDTIDRTPSHVYGAIGTAVTAAKLMRLEPAQIVTAIAYASGLDTIYRGFRNHVYGLVARNGMTAAYFGRAGAPAATDVLEGAGGFYEMQAGGVPVDIDEDIDPMESGNAVVGTVLKPWPCTGPNVVPVRLLGNLMRDGDIASSAVSKVRVSRSRPSLATMAVLTDKGPWQDPFVATSSLPFALGVTLVDGVVTRQRLEKPSDVEIFEQAQKVEIDFVDTDARWEHRLELHTRDGRVLEASGDEHMVDSPNPMETLQDHAVPVVGAEKANQLMSLVSRLEELDSVNDLTACIADSRSQAARVI